MIEVTQFEIKAEKTPYGSTRRVLVERYPWRLDRYEASNGETTLQWLINDRFSRSDCSARVTFDKGNILINIEDPGKLVYRFLTPGNQENETFSILEGPTTITWTDTESVAVELFDTSIDSGVRLQFVK